MLSRWILPLALLALLVSPVRAEDGKKGAGDDVPVVKEATSSEVKHELKIFKRDFDTVDIDFKLDALKRLARCVHKDITKKLLTILFRDKDPYVRAEAAVGLAHQVTSVDLIGQKVATILEDEKADPKILTALIRTMGTLDYRKSWEAIADLISHDDDAVVVACFNVLGNWKELRAYREYQSFWDVYPEEGKWATGSVNVDTGADTATEQRLAKAKWKAKYGNKAKQRPRPDCVTALKEAIKKITGEDIKKPVEFREWCRNHKSEIKKAKQRRD